MKIPLGYFIWGGVESRVRFYCSKLVDTDCESVEDIYLGDKNENKVDLFTKTEENKLRPASGISLELLDSWDETSHQQVYRVNVISKYCSKGICFAH